MSNAQGEKLLISEVRVTPVGQGAVRAQPEVAAPPAPPAEAVPSTVVYRVSRRAGWLEHAARLRAQRRRRYLNVLQHAAGEEEPPVASKVGAAISGGWGRAVAWVMGKRAAPSAAEAPPKAETPPTAETPPEETTQSASRFGTRRKLTAGERVLRDCAICAAVLLGVFAMRSIADPAVQQTAQTIQDAVTTDVDLSRQLGKLTFVWNWMPESLQQVWMPQQNTALSFDWPVSGTMVQSYGADAPWWEIETDELTVSAAQAGYVIGVARDQDGTYAVAIQHADAYVTRYANLASVEVDIGEQVEKGATLGALLDQGGSGKLQFEVARAGASQNPANLLPAS